jgi:hypothetical protein
MPAIPEYTPRTESVDTFQTRQTGGHAEASDFDPFGQDGAEKLAQGLNSLADNQNRIAAKEDMVWAQSQFAGAQAHMLENVNKYTDPDQFSKDYDEFVNGIAKTAPTGRASDFFVQHMDSFGPRMIRKVLINQAKASVGGTSDSFVSAANALAATATGGAQTPVIGGMTPLLGSVELRQVPNQLDQLAVSGKGVVPDETINTTIPAAKQTVGLGIAQAMANEHGSGKAADMLKKDPQVKQLVDKDTLQGVINTLRTQEATNQGVAISNAEKSKSNYLDLINKGISVPDQELTKFADNYAQIMAGPKGKKLEEERIDVLQDFETSKQAFSFKQSLIGLTPEQVQDKLLNLAKSEDPSSLKYTKEVAVGQRAIAEAEAAQRKQGVADTLAFKASLDPKDTPEQLQDKLLQFSSKYDETTPEYAHAAAALNALSRKQLIAKEKEAQGVTNDFVANFSSHSLAENQVQLAHIQAMVGPDSPLYNKASAWANKMNEDLMKSPADYPLNNSSFHAVYSSAVDALQKNPTDKTAIANYQKALDQSVVVQAQAQGWHPPFSSTIPANVGVIPKEMAQAYKEKIETGTPQDALNTIKTIEQQTGKYYPVAVRDLVRQGLDPKFQAVAAYAGSPVQYTAVLAIQNDKLNRETLKESSDGTSPITNSIRKFTSGALTDYRGALSYSTDGQKTAEGVSSLVESLTRQYMARGIPIDQAAQRASTELVHNFFDYGSTPVSQKTFLVPKNAVSDGDTASVIDGAKAIIPRIADGSSLFSPDASRFFGKAQPSEGEVTALHTAIATNGFWVPNPTNTGLRLCISPSDAAQFGIVDKTGNDVVGLPAQAPSTGFIEVPYKALQQFGRWNASRSYFDSKLDQMPFARSSFTENAKSLNKALDPINIEQ